MCIGYARVSIVNEVPYPIWTTLLLLVFLPGISASAETWRGMVVAPEHRCSPYEAADYSYFQSLEARIVSSLGGKVYSPYTGRCFSSPKDTDIEHIVARSEAHDSGLCKNNF